MQRFEFKLLDPAEASGPLIPFVPEPVDVGVVLGRRIEEWTPYAGTYGMGGPGFLGFRFEADWLIVALWGAAEWFRLDGRLVTDFFWEKHGRPRPWVDERKLDWKNLFVGRRFVSLDIAPDSMTGAFDNEQILKLSPDPDDRPRSEGNGEARALSRDDDLRSVVFIAPTKELWI